MIVTLGWGLAACLVILVAVGIVVSRLGHLGTAKDLAVSSVRAVAQLAAVSLIITAAVSHVLGAAAFCLLMLGVAVFTTARRVDTLRCWPWSLLAVAAGALPVVLIVFLTGAAPFTGIAVIPIAGIIIGNTMTAHTLAARGAFHRLSDQFGAYEAALSLGFARRQAVDLVIRPGAGEALTPSLDSTRTVGLVTLPGAFVGVLLGGGSPVQAGAAQVLVLVGILVAQAITTTLVHVLIAAGKLVPTELRQRLHR